MSAIPVVRVKRKDDGHVCTINASDFDPNLYEKVGEEKKVAARAEKPVEAKEPEPEKPAARPRRRRR